MTTFARVVDAAVAYADRVGDAIGDGLDVPEENPSAVIVALPTITTNLPRGTNDDPEPLHCTLAYIEEPDPDQLVEVRQFLTLIAAGTAPFTAKVSGRGRLGDQDAAVLILESDELADLHEQVAGAPPVPEDKFPNWIPHTTLGYGDDVDIENIVDELPDMIDFDRVALWHGESRAEFDLTGYDDGEVDGMDDDVLSGMERLDDEDGTEILVASGVSIPAVDGVEDLAAAIRYAETVPAARWYVAKRAKALQADASLPWEVPAVDAPDDADLELRGPGGVQAAAAWYIRVASSGGTPDQDIYDGMIEEAQRLGVMDDPVVASAVEWKEWLTP